MIRDYLHYMSRNMPNAVANIAGSKNYSNIQARAELYQTNRGVLVATHAYNLPTSSANPFGVFAYHIHSGQNCTGTAEDPFADALTHYNPTNQPHPYHAGDLPPLFSNNGHAFSVTLTNRFTVKDVLNRAMIIHSNPDDFTTQPSGNSGQKIACGIIQPTKNW